jgi:hypothetical protein
VLDDFWSLDAWGYAHKTGSFNFDANVEFLNYYRFGGGYTFRPAVLSDTATRGGPLMVNPGEHELTFNFNSDPRQIVSFNGGGEFSDNLRGGHGRSLRVGVNARPTDGLNLNLDFEYEWSYDTRQFVTSDSDVSFTPTYGRRYFFGELYRDEFSIEAGVDWILSPNLSVRAYVRPLLSTGNFARYKQLAQSASFNFQRFNEGSASVVGDDIVCAGGDLCKNDGRIYVDYTGDGVADTDFREQNFNVSSLLGNLVVRWEYSPGSQIFFVWQHNRENETDAGVFDVWTDAKAIFEGMGEHVFMIKATRYMSF